MSLAQARFQQAEYARQMFVVTAEVGTTEKDLLEPSYWAHVADQMHHYDRIEVRVDDGSLWAELLVLDCGRTWAKVEVIQKITPAEHTHTDASMEGLEVKWRGPNCKWSVVRTADNKVISEGHADKITAAQSAVDYNKALAA